MKRILLASLASLAIVACSAAQKDPLPTSTYEVADIHASLSAQSDGQTIKVFSSLLNGGFLVLANGDALTASVNGGAPVPLVEERDGSTIHYVGSLPRDAGKSSVGIAFTRANGGAGALGSTVDLPPIFKVTQPIPAEVSYADVLPVHLSGFTSYYVAIDLRGACFAGGGSKQVLQLKSDQHVDAPLSKWPLAIGAHLPCDVDVYVSLELHGKVDPAFNAAAPTTFEGIEHLAFKTTLVP